MSFVVQIQKTGGPEVLEWVRSPPGEPGPGEVCLRQTVIGVNFIDIYFRRGLYPLPKLPCGLGMEAAGVVEALGQNVTGLQVGDRVAYATPLPGAYAQRRVMSADRLVRLPEDIPDDTAAAMMLRGMTVHYLLRRTWPVARGQYVLVHAAAGGVGLMLCQWARYLGAEVIGVVGSPEKADLATAYGANHVIVGTREGFVDRVMEITDERGVDVVYDSVGRDTFMGSLDCLRPLGMMVSFGNASGPVPPVDPAMLAGKGSLFFTRPSLFHYIAAREDLEWAAAELFEMVRSGVVTVPIHQRYPLQEIARAHEDMETRRTTGSSILLP
ncbi:quinone oxidoreductase [Ectothiorhodospira shaposhnikovii]|uniref:quinone oxidoreductase family protein n=1 Tax=Ectothiorhodospira shaposhnikovii TaxID=1054 RepID=UPI001906B0A0|nr:quinone oxidoreductase [Ectothiorhodospira shaposhnikovii]MBK1673003.1 quinone oxidoreductase [Ectothiorhodospira shaposhnikovii]